MKMCPALARQCWPGHRAQHRWLVQAHQFTRICCRRTSPVSTFSTSVRAPFGTDGARQSRACRRDQPGHAKGAVGAPRSDGRAGDRRSRDLRAARAVHGAGDGEPDRVRGTFPCRKPSSTASSCASRSATGARERDRPARAPASRSAADANQRGRLARHIVRTVIAAQDPSRRSCVPISSRWLSHRAHDDAFLGASPRRIAGALQSVADWPTCEGGYVTPDDIQFLAQPALGHRIVMHLRPVAGRGAGCCCRCSSRCRYPVAPRATRRRSRLAAMRHGGQ